MICLLTSHAMAPVIPAERTSCRFSQRKLKGPTYPLMDYGLSIMSTLPWTARIAKNVFCFYHIVREIWAESTIDFVWFSQLLRLDIKKNMTKSGPPGGRHSFSPGREWSHVLRLLQVSRMIFLWVERSYYRENVGKVDLTWGLVPPIIDDVKASCYESRWLVDSL